MNDWVKLIRGIRDLFSRNDRLQFRSVVVWSVVLSSSELVSVAIIFPFLEIITAPEVVRLNAAYLHFEEYLRNYSSSTLVVIAGSATITTLMVAALIKSVSTYFILRYAQTRRHSLSSRLLQSHFSSGFATLLTQRNADVIKEILSEVDVFVSQIIQPITVLVGSLTSLLAIGFFLIYIDPVISLIGVAFLGAVYGGIFFCIKPWVQKAGNSRTTSNAKRFSSLNQILQSIIEIKVSRKFTIFESEFGLASKDFSQALVVSQTASQLPKFIVEGFVFSGIVGLSLILFSVGEDEDSQGIAGFFPLVGVYALAAYKLLPVIQNIYGCLTLLKFAERPIENFKRMLRAGIYNKETKSIWLPDGLRSLRFHNISFGYQPSPETNVIDNFNLELDVGCKLLILGPTGCGKSTLLKILGGIIQPDSGEIVINDSIVLNSDENDYFDQVSYVSQDSILLDESILENIVFRDYGQGGGFSDDLVRKCTSVTRVDELLRAKGVGLSHMVGDSGKELSGGQRQRILLARALYRKSDIVLLDEATSALDELTEQQILRAMIREFSTRTIVLVSHNRSLIPLFDKVLEL